MKYLNLTLFFLAIATCVNAQQKITDAGLSQLVKQQINYQRHLPVEKLYLHTDKPNYSVGDTIWFKGYLFNADYLKYSKSGVMYVELANDSNKIVFRNMVSAGYGIGYGQIVLDERDVPEGSYILRAYTNWQRNFSEDQVFTKKLYVTGAAKQPWLVNVKSTSTQIADKENIQSDLFFSDAGKALRLRELQLRVRDGRKTLLRGEAQTDIEGNMAVNFTLPEKSKTNTLNLQVEDLRKGEGNHKQNIPIVLTRLENADLQFMPEGGNLVAGITTKVAFKAVGEDGKGIFVEGSILDSKQQAVAKFTSTHKGMGSFVFNPKAGESYTANATVAKGIIKTYKLPVVQSTGTVMNVYAGTDSVSLRLTATGTISADTLYLTAQSRGIISYAEPVKLENYAKVITIPQSLFPTGITRFSLLNRQGQPLNERIVYIDHNDALKIAVNTDKAVYTARDSMAININVTDKEGKPIQGSFSLAVTDNEQVVADTLNNNIITSLLLTSDLKGTVEEPRYYLQNKEANKQALDNLLLTQGWVGYNWDEVKNAVAPVKFEPEPEFTIKGKVTNILNRPVANTMVMLLSKKPNFFVTSQTDNTGQFVFDNLPVTDTANYFVEATNKRDKSFGIGVKIDPFSPPEFNRSTSPYIPWYINTDTTMKKSVSQGINNRLEAEKLAGKNVLQQVEIRAKKVVKGSHNLNGPGEADLVLDEKDMEKNGDRTLGEMLAEFLPAGLRVQRLEHKRIAPYLVENYYMSGINRVSLFIDGFNIQDLVPKPTRRGESTPGEGIFETLDPYLNFLTAKDIKGIELMQSVMYRLKYDPPTLRNPGAIGNESAKIPAVTYIEITTYSGLGPYLSKTPGTYVFKPLPFTVPKQFYRPKYIDKTPSPIKDLRPTIHWEPVVITDEYGKATVSFYTSDKPNNYTVVLEGSDMNGKIGSTTQKINIAAAK